METSKQTSSAGVAESAITKFPTVVDSTPDAEYGDDVIRIRLVFDGDNLRQILMVDAEQQEVEWVRAEEPSEMRHTA